MSSNALLCAIIPQPSSDYLCHEWDVYFIQWMLRVSRLLNAPDRLKQETLPIWTWPSVSHRSIYLVNYKCGYFVLIWAGSENVQCRMQDAAHSKVQDGPISIVWTLYGEQMAPWKYSVFRYIGWHVTTQQFKIIKSLQLAFSAGKNWSRAVSLWMTLPRLVLSAALPCPQR